MTLYAIGDRVRIHVIGKPELDQRAGAIERPTEAGSRFDWWVTPDGLPPFPFRESELELLDDPTPEETR